LPKGCAAPGAKRRVPANLQIALPSGTPSEIPTENEWERIQGFSDIRHPFGAK
jgi:hypothetical protein